MVKVLHHEPESPRRLDHRIPRDLDTICLKCLQKNPSSRYASVGALLEDIRRYEAGEPLQARRPSWLSLAARWCRRHWRLAVAAVLAATFALLLVGPMFDRSYEEFVAWGDEELATGDTETAAQVYARAWNKGTEAEQRKLIGRIRQVCRTSDDPALAVELALNVITLDPTLSFGELDVLIAEALVTHERAASASGSIDILHERPRESLELVRQRLELALQRDVPDTRRRELEESLSAVKLVLGAGNPNIRYAPDFLHELPKGTLDEAEFSWREVAGTSYYQVQFEYTTETPHPISTMFAFVRTTETSLRPENLAPADRKALAENLLTGRTGGWSVEAFDADDRRIGLSLDTHRFTVSRELSRE